MFVGDNFLSRLITKDQFRMLRLISLLETRRDSNLAELKVTSHFVVQTLILERLLFITDAVLLGVSTIMYWLLSSANSLIFELMSVTMSLMNMTNKKEPVSNRVVHQL